MAGILLATKIHIPPIHGNLANRFHLIQRLIDLAPGALVDSISCGIAWSII